MRRERETPKKWRERRGSFRRIIIMKVRSGKETRKVDGEKKI